MLDLLLLRKALHNICNMQWLISINAFLNRGAYLFLNNKHLLTPLEVFHTYIHIYCLFCSVNTLGGGIKLLTDFKNQAHAYGVLGLGFSWKYINLGLN